MGIHGLAEVIFKMLAVEDGQTPNIRIFLNLASSKKQLQYLPLNVCLKGDKSW